MSKPYVDTLHYKLIKNKIKKKKDFEHRYLTWIDNATPEDMV